MSAARQHRNKIAPLIDLEKEQREIRSNPFAYYEKIKNSVDGSQRKQLDLLVSIQNNLSKQDELNHLRTKFKANPYDRSLIADITYDEIKKHVRPENPHHIAWRQFQEGTTKPKGVLSSITSHFTIGNSKQRQARILYNMCVEESSYHEKQIQQHCAELNMDSKSISTETINAKAAAILESITPDKGLDQPLRHQLK